MGRKRGVMHDYGGNSRGRKIRTKGNVERYECLHCGNQQVESKFARFRAPRVRCTGCGAVTHPMTAHKPPKKPKTRQCRSSKCKTQVRTDDETGYCTPCFNAMSPSRRTEAFSRAAQRRKGAKGADDGA